jgi:hypothetical protein
MSPAERVALAHIERNGPTTAKQLADANAWEDRKAGRVLLDLQMAGDLYAWSEASGKGPARKVYGLSEHRGATHGRGQP